MDILCLSGALLHESLDSALKDDIHGWITNLITDGSVDVSAEIYTGDHYVTIFKTSRIDILDYQLISKFFPEEPERSFQLCTVRVKRTDENVHIINCDVTSSNNSAFGSKARMYYFNTFHQMTEDHPFIWGGNFKTDITQLPTVLKDVHERYEVTTETAACSAEQPAVVQVLFSDPQRRCEENCDIAVTCGLPAVQKTSEVGKSSKGASDEHDVVIAKVCIETIDVRLQTTAKSKARPPPPPPLNLKPPTPLIDKMFCSSEKEKLDLLLARISREHIPDKLLRVMATPTGSYKTAESVAPIEKLEAFLSIVKDQRTQHLARCQDLPDNAVFTQEDMKQIYKNWMKEGSWMNKKTDSTCKGLRACGENQAAHQLRRKAFGTFLWSVIGNKHMLVAAIAHPLVSDAQLASCLNKLLNAWDYEKGTSTHQSRVMVSKSKTARQRRLRAKARQKILTLAAARKLEDR